MVVVVLLLLLEVVEEPISVLGMAEGRNLVFWAIEKRIGSRIGLASSLGGTWLRFATAGRFRGQEK